MPAEGCGDDGKAQCAADPSTNEVQVNAQKITKLRRETDERQCQAGHNAYCTYLENHPIRYPSGYKESVVFAAGYPSTNIYTNGQKLPTIFYWGLTFVIDSSGGFELYTETLDINVSPLMVNPAESKNPSEMIGIGLAVTKGIIWAENFKANQYAGGSHSSGGSWDVITASYFTANDKLIEGIDVGLSGGSPSLWTINTNAHPVADPGYFSLNPWNSK